MLSQCHFKWFMGGNTPVGGRMVVQGWARSPHSKKSSSSNLCGVCMFWRRVESGAHSILEVDPLRVITLYLQPKLISLVNTALFLLQTSCRQHEIHTRPHTNTSSPQRTSISLGLKVFTSRKQPWRVSYVLISDDVFALTFWAFLTLVLPQYLSPQTAQDPIFLYLYKHNNILTMDLNELKNKITPSQQPLLANLYSVLIPGSPEETDFYISFSYIVAVL